MPPRGFKIKADRPKWKLCCWVCGNSFEAIRSTAICCSAKCKKKRSRHHILYGHYPKKHPNAEASIYKHTAFKIFIR